MEMIADGLLIAGALTAALYCYVLSRRLSALKALDKGLGGAIAGLSARVEQTRTSLSDMRQTTAELTALIQEAERASTRLERLLAGGGTHELIRTRPSATEHENRGKPATDQSSVRLSQARVDPGRDTRATTADRDVPEIVSALRRIAANREAWADHA